MRSVYIKYMAEARAAYKPVGLITREGAWAQIRDALDHIGHTSWFYQGPEQRQRVTDDIWGQWQGKSGLQWWGKMEVAEGELKRGGVDDQGYMAFRAPTGFKLHIHKGQRGELAGFFPFAIEQPDNPADVRHLWADHRPEDMECLLRPCGGEDRSTGSFVLPPALYDTIKYWCEKAGIFGGLFGMIPVPYAAFVMGTKGNGHLRDGNFTMNGRPGNFCWGYYRGAEDSSTSSLYKHRIHFHHDPDAFGDAFLWDSTPLADNVAILQKAVDEWAEAMGKRPVQKGDGGYRRAKLGMALTSALSKLTGWYYASPANMMYHSWLPFEEGQHRKDVLPPVTGLTARRMRIDYDCARGIKVVARGVRVNPEDRDISACTNTVQHFLRALEFYHVTSSFLNEFPEDWAGPVDLTDGYEEWWFTRGGWKTIRQEYTKSVLGGLSIGGGGATIRSRWRRAGGSALNPLINLNTPEIILEKPPQLPTWMDSMERRKIWNEMTELEQKFLLLHYCLTGYPRARWEEILTSRTFYQALTILVTRDLMQEQLKTDTPRYRQLTDRIFTTPEEDVKERIEKHLGKIRVTHLAQWMHNDPRIRAQAFDPNNYAPATNQCQYVPNQGVIRSLGRIPDAVAPTGFKWGEPEPLPDTPHVLVQKLRRDHREALAPTWKQLEVGETPVPEPHKCHCCEHEFTEKEEQDGAVHQCGICGLPMCEDCCVKCSDCGREVCDECSDTCKDCKATLCTGCAIGGLCPECHDDGMGDGDFETEEEEEEEEAEA